jgi:hypothetical protein
MRLESTQSISTSREIMASMQNYGTKAFRENLDLIGPPNNDALTWNLSAGLEDFSLAAQSDLRQINEKLDLILRLLQNR